MSRGDSMTPVCPTQIQAELDEDGTAAKRAAAPVSIRGISFR